MYIYNIIYIYTYIYILYYIDINYRSEFKIWMRILMWELISPYDMPGSLRVCPKWDTEIHHGILGCPQVISLGKLTVCYWTWPFIVDETHENWWFSIVFCMFTRGYCIHLVGKLVNTEKAFDFRFNEIWLGKSSQMIQNWISGSKQCGHEQTWVNQLLVKGRRHV
jgi:hypothetical protein